VKKHENYRIMFCNLCKVIMCACPLYRTNFILEGFAVICFFVVFNLFSKQNGSMKTLKAAFRRKYVIAT
jgi:hypothetical protein